MNDQIRGKNRNEISKSSQSVTNDNKKRAVIKFLFCDTIRLVSEKVKTGQSCDRTGTHGSELCHNLVLSHEI